MGTPKTYIIAEIGINHNGSLENCLKMVDAAVDANCDGCKFQFFKAEYLYPRSAGSLDWKGKTKRYSYDIYNAVRGFEMPYSWVGKIINYCKKKRVDFLCSVFDIKNAGLLAKARPAAIKISSYSITNIPLIQYCAKMRLPLIISTGGAMLGEIEDAVLAVRKYHNRFSLLHCSIQYPTALKDCNLGVIETLRFAFPGIPIGWSDHTVEISQAPVQAVYLGARIIEKHTTLDKKMIGPDHFFALEPSELKKMVADIRKAEKNLAAGKIKIDREIYGLSEKRIFAHEEYLRNFCFPAIFASRNIKKGERIKYQDLALLRVGKKKRGLSPKHIGLFKGYKIYAVTDIKEEEAITWNKIFNA